jgi:hypothetical protein
MKHLLKKFLGKSPCRAPRRERPLRFESVEERRLMTASTAKAPPNDALLNLAETYKASGPITRFEMLDLLGEAGSDGKISAVERKDLIDICDPAGDFLMTDDVRDLTLNVVRGNPANRRYQGHFLGNLQAGNSSAKLNKLVDKWFYGDDLPAIDKSSRYEAISGSLFVNDPTYADIQQGTSGDCYLMSSLAELTVQDPAAIENMFIGDGDGTYTVRFFDQGTARYVTVNNELPVSIYGGSEYASYDSGGGQNELWVALAEKAYCQITEEGWTQHPHMNSYKAINAGSPVEMINEITGDATDFNPIGSRSPSSVLDTIASDFENGKAITLATKNHGTAANVVNNHSYAMIDYNATTQEVTLFNPWGLNNGTACPGLITLNWSEVVHSFMEWEVGDVS